jgi:hypothetical protein
MAAPVYKSTRYQGVTFHHVQIDLNDPNTVVVPQGGFNHLPLIDNDNWPPRWDQPGDFRQDLLAMYQGAPYADKSTLINTDYFCRPPCAPQSDPPSDPGAPQALFVRDGVMYHWPPPNVTRAALTFDNTNRAAIAAYQGWFDAPAQGIYNAVSGGPIILQGGTVVCNPENSDLGFRCGTSNSYRTAAGISADGRTLWLLASGKATTSTILANFIKTKLGAVNAMQFDGGSSTGLVFAGQYKVSPSFVGTGLLIRYRTQAVAPTPSAPEKPVAPGSVKTEPGEDFEPRPHLDNPEFFQPGVT